MKTSDSSSRESSRRRSAAMAGLLVVGLVAGVGSSSMWAERARSTKTRVAMDDRTIAHVLNRIGYGPAPGQVQELREMGLEAYIEQQLHPERMPDVGLRDRLASLSTLEMSSGAIAQQFYQPLLDMRQQFQKARAAEQARMQAANLPETPAAMPGMVPPTDTVPPPTANAPTASRAPVLVSPNAAMPQPPAPGSDDDLQARLDAGTRQAFQEARRKNRLVMDELAEQKLLRAVYSDRQLEAVLTDFWFNHFNVFAGKGPTQVYLTEYERDVIRPHVLGKFRDLLGATAHSPAMLFYLDNWQSVDPDAAERLRADQERRREVQARRRAAIAANVGQPRWPDGRRPAARVGTPDGSMPVAMPGAGAQVGGAPARSAGQSGQAMPARVPASASASAAATASGATSGQPAAQAAPAKPKPRPAGLNENYGRELLELHTLGVDGGYTQQDVIDVARCFTGWTIRQPREGGGFMFDERKHAQGPKRVLGHRIDRGGQQDGEAVLDLLATHPATATFIATKLVRRFVSDTPPKALVERVAATFRKTDGDLRAVMRSLLTSPEFLSADAQRAKVKTPFEFVASALRTTGAQLQDADAVVRTVASMGMPLYMSQPPTGYADRADAWVNTGALLTRMNFALALVGNKVKGVQVDLAALAGSPIAEGPLGAPAGTSVGSPSGSAAGAAAGRTASATARAARASSAATPPAAASGAPTADAGGTRMDVETARARIVAALLGGTVSPATRATIEKGTAVPQVAALTLGSPEFQRR